MAAISASSSRISTTPAGVKAVAGFIEDEQLGLVEDSARQAQTLQVAGGKLASFAVGVGPDGELVDDLIDNSRVEDALQTAGDFQVLAHGQVRVGGGIFDQVADFAPGTLTGRADGLAEDVDLPRCGVDHAQHGTDGGGLACAVQAQKAVDFARFDAQADMSLTALHVAVEF